MACRIVRHAESPHAKLLHLMVLPCPGNIPVLLAFSQLQSGLTSPCNILLRECQAPRKRVSHTFRDALPNSRRARRGFCGMRRKTQGKAVRLAWFCNEVDRPQNHAPEGVRSKTGPLPTKPLACASGTRRAVLAAKSSRFGLERAWREFGRASLGKACDNAVVAALQLPATAAHAGGLVQT